MVSNTFRPLYCSLTFFLILQNERHSVNFNQTPYSIKGGKSILLDHYLLRRYPKLGVRWGIKKNLCISYFIFARFIEQQELGSVLIKQIVIKTFIKMLKITCEMKTISRKIAGCKTATLLKINLLFLYRYFFRVLPNLL